MAIVLDGTTGINSPSLNAGNIVGQVCFFGMTTAPAGFLKANGAAVSRTTYADLFAAIGTTYGTGNGSTTFNLPDMRGEFPRGWDDGRGIDSGRAIGTAQTDAMQGHKHSASRTIVARQGADATFDYRSQIANANDGNLFDLDSIMNAAPVTDGTNGTPRTAQETRPRNVALLACIKF
jgi:microcystin-dependent protein